MSGIYRIGEILSSEENDDTCIDLLVSWFGFDAALDVDKQQPLVFRLTNLGFSKTLPNHRFQLGDEVEFQGERLRFFYNYDSDKRFAYLVEQPYLIRHYQKSSGGWADQAPLPLLQYLFDTLRRSLHSAAPSRVKLNVAEGSQLEASLKTL